MKRHTVYEARGRQRTTPPILDFDNQSLRLMGPRRLAGAMATTTGAEEPELKHWVGILLVILITAAVGAIIPALLYLL